jgi:hypothetical protein
MFECALCFLICVFMPFSNVTCTSIMMLLYFAYSVSGIYPWDNKPVHEQRWKVYIFFFYFFPNILNNFSYWYIYMYSIYLVFHTCWLLYYCHVGQFIPWYKYILSFESFANLNVSFFISRKLSLPLRHKKNITSNQHLWSKPFEVSGDKVKLVYSFLRSSAQWIQYGQL